MTLRRDLTVSRAPIGGFLGIGVFWGSLAAMLPELKTRLDLSDASLGVILLFVATGALIAMALAPRVDAAMPRLGLMVSGVAVSLAIFPIGFADTVVGFAIVMVAIGTATGLYDLLANARVSRLEARHNLSLMNLNHGLFSLAYAAAALATGQAREAGLSLGLWFVIIGLLSLLFCGLTYTTRASVGSTPDTPQASRGRISPFAFLAGLVVMFAFFSENATEGWSALHIERTLGGNAAEGALGPAMLGLTMGVGRLLGHVVTMRGGEMRVLKWAALLASGGLAVAAVAPIPAIAYVGFGLMGLGVSVVGPMALALAGHAATPETRTLAVSRAAMIGYFGFFIGPPLMGFLSEAFGLRTAFGVGALLLLSIPLLLLPQMRRHGSHQGVDGF